MKTVMAADLREPFDRVTYREGQLLTARDLVDDYSRDRRLRRLHARYLHDTWGIAIGFDVQPVGTASVAIGPGYALDVFDRELIAAASIVVPAPSAIGPQTYVLAMTFLDDARFAPTALGKGVCLTGGPLDPGRERPGFVWCTPGEFEPGPMVPLCSVVVSAGFIQGGIQTRVRRYARRLVRPHIVTGITDVDDNAWNRWWVHGILNGVEREVSTVEAGFTTSPLYFAELVAVAPGEHPDEVVKAIAQAHGHISSTAVDKFVFRAIVQEPFVPELRSHWAVSWIGIEPLAGCPPSLDLRRLITLLGPLFRNVVFSPHL